MFLSQVPTTAGLEVAAIADLDVDVDRARVACRAVGWSEERIAATVHLQSGAELVGRDDLEEVVEAVGSPATSPRARR